MVAPIEWGKSIIHGWHTEGYACDKCQARLKEGTPFYWYIDKRRYNICELCALTVGLIW